MKVIFKCSITKYEAALVISNLLCRGLLLFKMSLGQAAVAQIQPTSHPNSASSRALFIFFDPD